jgi:transposase-like protein
MNDQGPPFCANPHCVHHWHIPSEPYTDYERWGSYSTAAFGIVPRFRCTSCGKTFSAQTFRVNYWLKRVYSYEDLGQRLSSCSSIRALGRAYKVAGKSIQNRIGRAARQVLALDARLSSSRKPTEDLVADGFESFCVSQFFPNNIHLLVGSKSQFVYESDHVTLRRKGSMTDGQKRKRDKLDAVFRPDPHGIEKSFSRIATSCLSILSDEGRPELTLWTDEKRDYPRAITVSACASALRDQGRFIHRTISSRAARTLANPLFPVNYLDRELRKDLHEHVRETVCFGRNVNAQMERLTVYLFQHNYRKRHRTRSDGRSNAVVAGYDESEIAKGLTEVWEKRAWYSRTDLTASGNETWLRLRKTPLGKEREYLPKHAVA